MEMSSGAMGMSGPSASSSNSSSSMQAMTSNMGGMMYFTTQLPFTMLFPGWVVSNGGQLAGAWFFAFFLALLFEALQALSSVLAARWKRKMAKQLEAGSKCECGPACAEGPGVCCCSGKGPAGSSQLAKWWRAFSTIDHARALLRFAMAAVAYLMMLAVMTFNVAIFFAVVGGIYIGALLRRAQNVNEHSAADFHHFGSESTLDKLPAGTVLAISDVTRKTNANGDSNFLVRDVEA